MNYQKWLLNNTSNLSGKLIAITGSTGGLGRQICRLLLGLNADLILLDRNFKRSTALAEELLSEFPTAKIELQTVDLEDMTSIKAVTEELKKMPLDIFIHNAGAYSIPRHKCDTGFDNVFQINFLSPYYIIKELLPILHERHGRVVAMGSIAHNYSKADFSDLDFSTRTAASKVYGNAKRFLMFSLFELFKTETEASLSVVHPGITFTNITAHYPKIIFAVIKHPMKVIFMSNKKAALSVVKGIFEPTEYHTWIGPRIFKVWGLPKKQKLRTCGEAESQAIGNAAEEIYISIK